ncbi:MAG: YjzC family protein [Nitrosopumilus sp.]|nr:YjzC family protein [Nitrosopumilus sp.]
MPSRVFDNIFVRTGGLAPESGHYIYKGNPKKGVLPCIPTKEEKVITLERGEAVPPIRSCCNHEAVYRLTISTSS